MKIGNAWIPQGLVCFGLAFASCGSEGTEEPGSLRLTWRLGGKSCAELGVVTVRVFLRGADGRDVLDTPPSFPCAEGMSGVVVEDVPAGTYLLVLEGLTTDGHPSYQGTRQGVRIERGKETVLSQAVNLELKKSEFLLNWEFPLGTGQCNGNQVVQVEAMLYDSVASQVYGDIHPCVLPPESYPELGVLIANLRGNEEMTFILYGLNNKKPAQKTHRGEKTIKTVPGERTPVNVVLEPCPGPDQCP